MQDRLFKQLGEWSMLPDETLRREIIKIGGSELAPIKLTLHYGRVLRAKVISASDGKPIAGLPRWSRMRRAPCKASALHAASASPSWATSAKSG